jgi:hypothetical protein
MSGHQPKGRGYSPSNKPPNMGSGVRPASWADPYGYGTGRPEDRQVEDLLRPQFSGLYDADGIPLYRRPNPVGFETDPSRRIK